MEQNFTQSHANQSETNRVSDSQTAPMEQDFPQSVEQNFTSSHANQLESTRVSEDQSQSMEEEFVEAYAQQGESDALSDSENPEMEQGFPQHHAQKSEFQRISYSQNEEEFVESDGLSDSQNQDMEEDFVESYGQQLESEPMEEEFVENYQEEAESNRVFDAQQVEFNGLSDSQDLSMEEELSYEESSSQPEGNKDVKNDDKKETIFSKISNKVEHSQQASNDNSISQDELSNLFKVTSDDVRSYKSSLERDFLNDYQEPISISKKVCSTGSLLETVNISSLLNLRDVYKDEFHNHYGYTLNLLPFVIKALNNTLNLLPQITGNNEINLEVAINTHKFGPLTPTLNDIAELSIIQLSSALKKLNDRAENETLPPESFKSSPFIIYDNSHFPIQGSMPVIEKWHKLGISIHRSYEKVVVLDRAITVIQAIDIGMTYDLRFITFEMGVFIMNKIKDQLEEPQRLLLMF